MAKKEQAMNFDLESLKKELPKVDYDMMVSDEFRNWGKTGGRGGGPVTGKVVCTGPFEMEMILDFTGLRGSGSNIFHVMCAQLPKWDYKIRKVDEWIEVSPTWAEYYNITIAQKNKLEASIKQGLTSASQSVADYELLKHDLRRYREILDYFVQAQKTGDEHVLRSIFVDRVDQHTGEGYSMMSIARRWPTIITDFIRMKSEWMDRDAIRKGLDVTDAEATVLLTKNQLYKEWKELFLPTIKDRMARLEVLVESRRKSIDEYRNWLKPYVARYKIIRERTELKPNDFATNPYYTPVFGPAKSEQGARLWAWKTFSPPERGKTEGVRQKGAKRGFIIDPYDDLVREYKAKIEHRYQVTISDKEVDDLLKQSVQKSSQGSPLTMDPNYIYYVFFDFNVYLSLLRTPPPEGMESDNLMFLPLKAWVMSQNALLVHLLEIFAIEKSFEQNINRLIGTREAEEEALWKIEKEFLPEEKVKRNYRADFQATRRRWKPHLEKVWHLFVKPGPYEPVFDQRVSKMYARGIGKYYGQIVDFLMKQMQVD